MTNIELQALNALCHSLPVIAKSLSKIATMMEKLSTDFVDVSATEDKGEEEEGSDEV